MELVQRRARQALRWPRSRVRWKILGPFALLTFAFASLGTYLATQLVTGSLEERFTNQLVESARAASDAVVRQERAHLEAARGVAFTDGVAEAVRDQDPARLDALIAPFVVNAGTHQVEVLDVRGERVYGIRREAADEPEYVQLEGRASYAGLQAVADVLGGQSDSLGDKFAQLASDGAEPQLYTAGPIETADGQLAGVVLVSTPLSVLLPTVTLEALADVIVLGPDGQVIDSTFGSARIDADLGVPDGASPAAGRASRQRAEVAGRGYELLISELRIRDQPVGTIAVALPTDYIAQAGGATRLQMSLLFAGITLAVLLLGLWIARQFTGPVQRLAGLAKALTEGDLSARSEVRGLDEIGVLGETFDRMAERLQRQQLTILGSLASAIDARDPYTAGHSLRVGLLSADMGRHMGMGPAALHHLMVGGYLHDIGKIGVRDNVLLKEGKLTEQEFRLIQEHPRIGLNIIAPAELPAEVIAIVGGHHEKLDGSGYPNGLSQEEISVFPRVAAIADIYDALTTDRPYRKAMDLEETLALLDREAAKGLLDASVVSVIRTVSSAWEERRRSDPLLLGFTLPEALGRDAA